MECFIKKTIVVSCVIIFLSSDNVVAVDDDYMKLLESEAEDTMLDRGVKQINNANNAARINTVKKDWLGKCDPAGEAVPSNLLWEEFSSYLKQCAVGSFVFYQRLKLNSQYSVYEKYKKRGTVKLEVLRKYILKYF